MKDCVFWFPVVTSAYMLLLKEPEHYARVLGLRCPSMDGSIVDCLLI